STKSGRRNCSGETLTATLNDGQLRPSRQARRSNELAEFDNQAGMLRNRNETPWRYFALDGMNPTGQPLDPGQPLPPWIDDRLIDDVQLLISDRLTERAFQQFAVREIGVHRGIVDARPVAAFALGAIERHIGVTQDVAGVLEQLSITAMPIDAPILMLCPLRTNGAQMMPRMRSVIACNE